MQRKLLKVFSRKASPCFCPPPPSHGDVSIHVRYCSSQRRLKQSHNYRCVCSDSDNAVDAMEYCISSCCKTASLVPLAQTEEQGTKIISHALLSPLLTSTCFHRQMLMLLLRAITRHQTALQKKKQPGHIAPYCFSMGFRASDDSD